MAPGRYADSFNKKFGEMFCRCIVESLWEHINANQGKNRHSFFCFSYFLHAAAAVRECVYVGAVLQPHAWCCVVRPPARSDRPTDRTGRSHGPAIAILRVHECQSLADSFAWFATGTSESYSLSTRGFLLAQTSTW